MSAPIRPGKRLVGRALAWDVLVGQHSAHAGCLLGLRHIDGLDLAARNGRSDDDPVENVGLLVLVGIRGPAGHLCRAVDAIDATSDHEVLRSVIAATSARVRRNVFRASWILKSLSPRPTAPSIAMSAAAW